MLVLDHQIHQSGSARIITNRYYYSDTHDVLTYGLLQKTIVKKVYDNLSSLPAEQIRHYYYTLNRDGYSKTLYSTIELGKGRLQQLPAVTISQFTNQTLEQANAAGTNITRYHYDDYGRLIQKDVAVNTAFATYIHYQYNIAPRLNQILITSANGLQKKIIFNSAGKKLQEWNEIVSVTGRAELGQWLLKKQFEYDRYGHIFKDISYVISSLKKQNKLITVYYYDDMGALTQVTLPDGQRVFKLYNDSEQCMISYRMSQHNQRSVISIVHYNTLNKPIQKITLPAFQGSLSAVKKLCYHEKWQQGVQVVNTTYDGFGRVISTTDPAGRTITTIYNSLGEVAVTKDSFGHEIHYFYDLSSHLINASKQYKTSSGVAGWLMYAAQYNPAGELMWKTNAFQQRTTYTYTTDGNPATITTSEGHIISFRYNLLGLPIASYIDGKLQLKNDYDPITALLIKKTDSTGTTRYLYSDDGMLQQEIHTGENGYPDYHLKWFYDLNRRLIAVTDINDNKTLTQYDSLGRITALYYQRLHHQRQLLARNRYDDFSRTTSIDYGSGMYRTLSYDNYGRRYQVKDMLNNQLLSKWYYSYDIVNNIVQLKQQGNNNQTGLLNYRYDEQNNLIAMSCHGSTGLPFCPRDTAFTDSGLNNAPVIISQHYHFNPLNRMTEVNEGLQDSSGKATLSKVISYHYYKNMPLRLQRVSTSWNNNLSVSKSFSYDKAGNMIMDGENNQINFNPFNQIVRIITTQGKYSYYNYDASGKEVLEKTAFSKHYFFYRSHRLINENIQTRQDQTTHIIGYQNIARTMDGVVDQYYEKNYKGDITGVLTRSSSGDQYRLSQSNTYSPYGMSWHHPGVIIPFYQQLLTGFNSERSDPVTHWQFLGTGHRTYNPYQHYFVSEDPAGDGYSFAANNPIMNTDPDGNMSKSLKIINYITTLGLGAIHKRWVEVIGFCIVGIISVMSLGFSTYVLAHDIGIFVSGIITSSLSSIISVICSAPKSDDKVLNITRVVTGSISLAIALVAGTTSLGIGIFNGIKGMYSAGMTAENIAFDSMITGSLSDSDLLSESMAEQAGDIPLVPLRNAGASANLGEDLLQINANFMISEQSGISYLTLQNNEQIDNAVIALQQTRRVDDNIAAALTASKISGKPLNLKSVEEYLVKMENMEPSSLLSYRISDTEKSAISQLFEPFGALRIGETDFSGQSNYTGFIGHNLRGTFVAYRDANTSALIVAKYNYASCMIERFNLEPVLMYYNCVNCYVVF
ncbi:MAG: hypothetical protein OXC48_03950 [Endozoicomonadaceae bacterium]|nr:hypothetical protein [Endozoicomonadaceae bacterium]